MELEGRFNEFVVSLVPTLPLFEIAFVLVTLGHVADRIVNENHSMMRSTNLFLAAFAACAQLGCVPDTATTTFDIFCWLEVATNFDELPLFQSAPNRPDYIDILVLWLHRHLVINVSPLEALRFYWHLVCKICQLGCINNLPLPIFNEGVIARSVFKRGSILYFPGSRASLQEKTFTEDVIRQLQRPFNSRATK